METIKTNRSKISYNLDALDIYRKSIKQFAAEWPNKPREERGKKLTVRSVSVGLATEINILINKGYTVAEVVTALFNVGFIISPVTLKSYFSTVKVKKNVKIKKTVNKIKETDLANEIDPDESECYIDSDGNFNTRLIKKL